MKPFGTLLAELRKKAGLSQNGLAQVIKTNPAHISKIERGDRNPPKMNTIVEIAKALGIADDKEKMNEFVSSALFTKKGNKPEQPSSPLVYSSPLSGEDIVELLNEETEARVLQSPVIKLITDILRDPDIPDSDKDEIESKTLSFVGWLNEERIRRKSE